MVRVVGALLLTLCGGGAGVIFAEKLRETRDLSRQTSDLIRALAASVRGRETDLFRLIGLLRADDRLGLLTFLSDLPEDFAPETDLPALWRQSASSQPGASPAQRQLLSEISFALTAADSESVLRSLEVLEERSRQLEMTAQDRLERCGRLYRSLGLLFGAMAGILVI
ncbi:MAG: hypothetical protein IJ071_06225 [Ruminococcus sp.]|nr:hypothetical protein [Ruminococcus sp.]